MLAHLGYLVRCSRSLNLLAPSFSTVLLPLLFKPVAESALSPFSCWPTSATMYDALLLSTSRLPLSLLFSVPYYQRSGGVGSVAMLLLAHLGYHVRCSPSLNLQTPSFSIVFCPLLSSQWWSQLCRHSPAGPPRLPCTMLLISTSRLTLYHSLSPLIQASGGVGSVAILLLAHLGYHVRCSRSFNLQAPSFSIVLCPLLFSPAVEWALLPFSCWPTSATMYDALPLSASSLPFSPLFCVPS